MAVIVPAIGQLLWGEPLNNALLGLDSAIQGKTNTTDFVALQAQVNAVQVQASNAQSTANSALSAASNVPGVITVSGSPPTDPTPGQYWDNGSNLFRYNGTSWQPPNYLTPQVTTQTSSTSIGSLVAGVVTDFPSGMWAPITFTVPPSGRAKISIGAALRNTQGASATGWVQWRASGGITFAGGDPNGISIINNRLYGSRVYVLSGMTPNTVVTITPQYYFSALGATDGTTGVTLGQLIVEPIPL